MARKLPEDAFAYYVSLGAERRSYKAVGDHYGVTKRAVVKAAGRENWTARLAKIDRDAQERADEKLVSEREETRMRHQKMLRAMAARAIKGIGDFPLTTGMEAIRTAELVIKLERLIIGEPNERSEVSIAEVTRQEIDRFIASSHEPEESEDTKGSEPESDADDDW